MAQAKKATKKASPRRKVTKTTARKAPKTLAKRTQTVRKTSQRVVRKVDTNLVTKAVATSRNLFLAGLGVYGKVADGAEDQLNVARKRLASGRKQADKLYGELVKRGEKVQSQATRSLRDIDVPELALPRLDRKTLEAQLSKARARLVELRSSFKKAA